MMTVRLAGATNFRQLGGYTGHQARWVAPRRIFRSDHLGHLTAHDVAVVEGLGVRRVLDLRGVQERETAPCAAASLAVHSLPIEPTIVQVLGELIAAGHQLTPAEVVAHMRHTYRRFVRNNTPRFAQVFEHLLASDEPTVFHCTAGKDRTGLAAALVLRSLGVSQEDVMRDYLLTNERLQLPEGSRHGLAPEVTLVLSRVQPEFLHASLETIDADYGGMEAYFRDGLRLGEPERERLRELYLL